MNTFKVGEQVTWTSQAQGYQKTKTGTVVAVVPAGKLPDREKFTALYKGPGVGGYRDHESYVVEVAEVGVRSKKTKAYWPRVSALRSPSRQMPIL